MRPRCITTRFFSSPCGELLLGSLGEQLCLCDWRAGAHHARTLARVQKLLGAEMVEGDSPALRQATAELCEYFEGGGKRQHFSLPLLFTGTVFQQGVWQQLMLVPYGQVISYGELAQRLGMPRAVRAVANAVAANAISLFAPCHRIIASGGRLGGFAGGVEAKCHLLALESLHELTQDSASGKQKA